MCVCNGKMLVALVTLLGLASCLSKSSHSIQTPGEGLFFNTLEEYHFFEVRGDRLIPNESLVSYDVINALFTDYALKDRFIYLPEGSQAQLNSKGTFDFPQGTILVKNFFYSKEQTDRPGVIETRLLVKDSDEWRAISYVWDTDGKTAKISKVGATIPHSIGLHGEQKQFDYIVPNKNQCKSCHNYDDKIDPLGFKYANLNKVLDYGGQSLNQIDYLVSRGVIDVSKTTRDSLITMAAYTDGTVSAEERALAYLDVNCGHCHRPNGPGNTSGLFLQHNETRTNHLGFCKSPVAAGKGSGGRKFDIYPGQADSSILVFRMSSIDPGMMMPEVGRTLVHEEGLEIIRNWINQMEFDCYE